MLEDEFLKWKFKRGSRQALSRIYDKYVNNMLSLAMGLLNDAYEAEDVVQDVFVSFAKSANRFKQKGSLKSYLAQSVVNRVRDRMRSEQSRRNQLEQDEPGGTDSNDPEQSIVYTEQCERLSNTLAQLPLEQREVVVLKVKNDMTLKAIAKLQGVSISTVHGRYRYGMEKLKNLLNGEV